MTKNKQTSDGQQEPWLSIRGTSLRDNSTNAWFDGRPNANSWHDWWGYPGPYSNRRGYRGLWFNLLWV